MEGEEHRGIKGEGLFFRPVWVVAGDSANGSEKLRAKEKECLAFQSYLDEVRQAYLPICPPIQWSW